jgi:spectinomycin phosphotransferase
MLEKPDLPDRLILCRIQDEYGLQVARLAFLPLGADVNTAVYRLETHDGATCFLKLRKGAFDETSVRLPQFLHSLSIRAVIPPLETRLGQLWGSLDPYKLMLYPFIEEADALELTDRQWLEFGAALKRIHSAKPPPALKKLLQRETFAPDWRESVKTFQRQVEQRTFDEPVAARLAAFMRAKRDQISHLVRRAEELALALQARPREFVLCHSDVHAGNLLVGADGSLYIVDWDNPILAPKERDLMFIGGGVSASLSSARGEALFYQGYGPTEVDRMALAYYRYERIVVDIAEFCKQLLLSEAGGEDREQSYRYFTSNFLAGHEFEIACQADGKDYEESGKLSACPNILK